MFDLKVTAFLNALGVVAYTALVAWIMQSMGKIEGEPSLLGPMAFLMLFVLSAAITGSLVLGRPVLLYLDGLKAEAVRLLLYTIGWLGAITIIALLVNAFLMIR